MLEVSQPIIAYYESGKRNVPSKLLIPISEALSVSITDLLGTERKEQNKSKFELRLEQIAGLSRRKQDRILSVIDTLLADASKS